MSIVAPASGDVDTGMVFSSNAAALQGLSFAWSFGDGQGSTEASPRHSYAKVGDYEVGLKVSNTAGSAKELKLKISINNRAHVRGLACAKPGDGGWCWQQPMPSGELRGDYFFVDAQTGWSVGDVGEIFKTVDGGRTWSKQSSGVSRNLWKVHFSDANNGWVTGVSGLVLRTSNGGETWTKTADSKDVGNGPYWTRPKLLAINAQKAIITDGSNVSYTADGGASWSERAIAGWLAADGTYWSLTSGGLLNKSTDGGATQTTVLGGMPNSGSPPVANGVSFELENRGALAIAITTYEFDATRGSFASVVRIRRSVDGGASWETITAQGLDLKEKVGGASIAVVNANKAYLSVDQRRVYRSVDGWRTWSELGSPAAASYSRSSLLVLDGGVLLSRHELDANRGEFFVSQDDGATWARVERPPIYDIKPQRLGARTWLLRDSGRASISTDDMSTWHDVSGLAPSPDSRVIGGAWLFDTKHWLGFNAEGNIVETFNSGVDWAVKAKGLLKPSGGALGSLFFASASHGWLLSAENQAYRTVDGGQSWMLVSPEGYKFLGIHFVDSNNGYAVARVRPGAGEQPDPDLGMEMSVVLATADGGQSWVRRSRFPGLASLQFASSTNGVATRSDGSVRITNDGGLTWTEKFKGSSGYRVVFTSATTVWVLGRGSLLRSNDAGLSWAAVTVPSHPDYALNQIRFLDAQRGWIVGDGGNILYTQDGGASWVQQVSGASRELYDVIFSDSHTGWIRGRNDTILTTGTGGN